MFAVPEVDDDIDVSTSIDVTKSITQPGESKESIPSASMTTVSPPPPSLPTTEKVEKNSAKISIPPPPSAPPASSKQHRSRRSLFHRNTIHICDQIGDRM